MLSSKFIPLISFFLMFSYACNPSTPKDVGNHEKSSTIKEEENPSEMKKIDIQGHRGCRGLMPENTIPAFLKALELGVTTLELDVVITKDKEVVVSHEPWLSHEICTDAKGDKIKHEEEKQHNIYEMTYEELKSCDCGQTAHPRFPDQQKMAVYKPKLADLIDAVNEYAKAHQIEGIWYNIEIKRQPDYDGKYCPVVDEFVDLVLEVVKEKGIVESCNLQSFDWEVLRLCKEKAPAIPLAMLVENELSPEENLKDLGFTPEIYSCYFKLIDDHLLAWVKENEMQLIPWTVNEEEDIKAMLKLPLDGIITDYPDRLMQIINEE
jgi:glycerophosphoryl diester phosphodiesterase